MRIRKQLRDVVPGAVIAVPMVSSDWTVGVVLATSQDRHEMLLHFPDALFDHRPTPEEALEAVADPDDRLWLGSVACQGFFQGDWSVVTKLEPFQRDDWGLPLGFQAGGRPPYYMEIYDYDNLDNWTLVEVEEPDQEFFMLPEGGLAGSLAAELLLRKLHHLPIERPSKPQG